MVGRATDRSRKQMGNVPLERNVLEPVVMRYKERKVRLYFRGDAAFASPEIYEYLEAEGLLYVIRLKASSRRFHRH